MIFGANGFLGSVIANNFFEIGEDIICVVRPSAECRRIQNIPKGLIERVDTIFWEELIQKHHPKTIYCANWSGVEKINRDEKGKQIENVNKVLALGNSALQQSVETFIAFGSQAEHKPSRSIASEDYLAGPESEYGKAKNLLYVELEKMFRQSRSRFVWARIYSIFGPANTNDNFIHELFHRIKNGLEVRPDNPKKIWSLLFENDFASAMKYINSDQSVSGIVNIGNPNFVYLEEIFASARTKTSLNARPLELVTEGFYPSVAKLTQSGWRAEYSIGEALELTMEGFSQNCSIGNCSFSRNGY
jgi:nucleoside-diphosphate-sugar epimerase